MAHYLITGGAGFIGSNLTHALLNRGDEVRVLDNFSTGRHANVADIVNEVEIIEGDLRDAGSCKQAVAGVDYVLHLASIPSVEHSVLHPDLCMEVNVNATINLLLAARDANVKRLVFASSSAIYGDSPVLPKSEEMKPLPPSPYAVGKLAAEHSCQIFYKLYGLETVCLRYFNVFGPRQDPTSQYSAVIPLFARAMLSGKAPIIFGDGLQSRDFTYVNDIIQANLLAVSAPDVAGQVFNIACGQSQTLLDLVAALNAVLNTSIEPVHAPPRQGEVKHSVADISRAEKLLGYKVGTTFAEGLAKTAEWYSQFIEKPLLSAS